METQTYSMKQLTPADQLAFSTVRIECEVPGGTSVGTGFFFRCCDFDGKIAAPVIVTNKHVVKDATKICFNLTAAAPDGSPVIGSHSKVCLDTFPDLWIDHPDDQVDLCVLPIASLMKQAADQGKVFFYVNLDKSLIPSPEEIADMGTLEDIVMVGYPSGFWDEVNNRPIFRKGVTATSPDLNYMGRGQFLIDAAVFQGSSGSPVFLYNSGGYYSRKSGFFWGTRLKFLGILYAVHQHRATGEVKVITVPTGQKAIAETGIPNNLGLVLQSRLLLDFDPLISARAGKPA